jgi:hypothetical protein
MENFYIKHKNANIGHEVGEVSRKEYGEGNLEAVKSPWHIRISWSGSHQYVLRVHTVPCRRVRVTNNCGFWIWWPNLLTPSFTITLKYRQYSAIGDLLTSGITRTCYPFPSKGFITQKLSSHITIKSSCHFVFNHSVRFCPHLYSTLPPYCSTAPGPILSTDLSWTLATPSSHSL